MPVPRDWPEREEREPPAPSAGVNWWSIVGSALAAALASAVGVGIGIQIGLARVEVRVASLENTHREMHQQIEDLDQKGSRTVPVLEAKVAALEARSSANMPAFERVIVQSNALEQRLKLLEDIVNNRTKTIEEIVSQARTLTPLQQIIVEQLRTDIKRIEERQDRIVQALDQIYAQMQDHVRGGNNRPKQDLRK